MNSFRVGKIRKSSIMLTCEVVVLIGITLYIVKAGIFTFADDIVVQFYDIRICDYENLLLLI